MFNIVLVQPEIPPNTGNIIRLCANTGCKLHLIKPIGFSMDDKQMRRAGLDYHEYAPLLTHESWASFLLNAQPQQQRIFAMTTRATALVHATAFKPGDWLVFGSETQGLPSDIRQQIPIDQCLKLPMLAGQRSLNLSNAVAITTYEAWRQNNFGTSAQTSV
jgi:tRNA (cytidine/uridine-2'-O-)-methyltransferase